MIIFQWIGFFISSSIIYVLNDPRIWQSIIQYRNNSDISVYDIRNHVALYDCGCAKCRPKNYSVLLEYSIKKQTIDFPVPCLLNIHSTENSKSARHLTPSNDFAKICNAIFECCISISDNICCVPSQHVVWMLEPYIFIRNARIGRQRERKKGAEFASSYCAVNFLWWCSMLYGTSSYEKTSALTHRIPSCSNIRDERRQRQYVCLLPWIHA